MFGPEKPPDHCEQCKDEYEAKQREYLRSLYGYGYIRTKPQKSLAERDPRAWFERLLELQRRAGDEEPTNETLSTFVPPPLLDEKVLFDPFTDPLTMMTTCIACGGPRLMGQHCERCGRA